MSQPIAYDAQRELMAYEMSQPVPEPVKTPQVHGDPLRSFEYEHSQLQTDMRQWLTFLPEDRLKRTEILSRREVPRAVMVRDMGYIIWMEARAKEPNREAASLAFRILFPPTPATPAAPARSK